MNRRMSGRMHKRTMFALIVGAALTAGVAIAASASGRNEFPAPPPASVEQMEPVAGAETAVFAGGCFWGVEAVFERLNGVTEVLSGYSGGDASTASYYTVASGTTRHAESVQIIYDPSVISYGTLLEVLFAVAHDPTQLNYQGPDHGPQYRSAIFFVTGAQRSLAESYIRDLDRAGVYGGPIVTEVVPFEAFYPAEDYHQDFIRNNPTYPYVVYWDLPKLSHLEQAYPDLVSPTSPM